MRAYTEYEYSNTHDMRTGSAAVHMIRVQAEQIRRMSAEEYLKEKTGSGADGQEDTPWRPLTRMSGAEER